MAQFLSLDDAAERLGITKDELNQRRDAGDIRGFRDGASWKFKEEEVERFATELASGDGDDILDLAGGDFDLGNDSILLSEQELGPAGKGPSSTVIGKSGQIPSEDSDVKMAAEMEADSDINLGDSHSDVQLSGAGTSDVLGGVSGLGAQFEDLEELDLDLDAESGKVISDSGADSLKLGAGDLALGDTGSALSLTGDGSDFSNVTSDLGIGSGMGSGGSALDLAADEDDELVLGEGSGSDITMSSGDSGIGLASPSDSGLSLDEEPLELGGSTVESLELGEDDEVSLDLASSDPDAATQLKADDDFMLTPLDEVGGDETEDSGSQVIALDSESFDESADTMLGGAAMASGAAALADQLGDMSGSSMTGSAASPLMPAPMTVPEAPYSIWNVLSLAMCFIFLALTGMMMFDLLRNMWSWDESYALNSSIMDGFINMIGWPTK
jgi:excisionase family DNA binding protein